MTTGGRMGKVTVAAIATGGMICLGVHTAQARQADFDFDIPAQPLAGALRIFARTSHAQIIFDEALVERAQSSAVHGRYASDVVLQNLLARSGLTARHDPSGVYIIAEISETRVSEKQAAAAPADTPLPPPVTVNGKRPDITDKVDRRVYNLANDASATIGMASDLLARIPSIQVSPTGVVSLRGDSHVTILIDGKEPSNGNQALLSLAAADIDRIEVITNPSAQYGPGGSAGIINIITKKRFPLGISGSFNPQAGGNRQQTVSALVNLKAGKWSAKTVLNYNHNPLPARSTTVYTLPEAASSSGDVESEGYIGRGDLTVDYKIDDLNTLTLNAVGAHGMRRTANAISYVSATTAYDAVTLQRSLFDSTYYDAAYTYANEATGTTLTIDADRDDNAFPLTEATETTYRSGGTALFGQTTAFHAGGNDYSADLEQTFGPGRTLTAGLSWAPHFTHVNRLYYDVGEVPGPYADGLDHDFFGRRDTLSAYMTWQQDLAGWTSLWGLRVESQAQAIRSDGLTARRRDDAVYPSLNLMHGVSDHARIKLSYSRRVDPPDIFSYDPGYWTSTSETRAIGNPDLKPPKTDSLEAQYVYSLKDINVEGSLFSRTTHDLLTRRSFVADDGVVVSQPVNAGQSRSSGAAVTLKAPLTPRLRYTLNLTLLDNDIPLFASGRRNSTGLNGNLLLEYERGPHGKLKGDLWQVKLNSTGRSYNPQGYTEAFHTLNITWQHPVTTRLTLVVDGIDVTNGAAQVQVVDTANLKYRTKQTLFGTYWRLGLAYKFAGSEPSH